MRRKPLVRNLANEKVPPSIRPKLGLRRRHESGRRCAAVDIGIRRVTAPDLKVKLVAREFAYGQYQLEFFARFAFEIALRQKLVDRLAPPENLSLLERDAKKVNRRTAGEKEEKQTDSPDSREDRRDRQSGNQRLPSVPHICRGFARRKPGFFTLVLKLVKTVIDPTRRHQFHMGTRFPHLAVMEHNNPISIADGGQAVGDDETRPAFHYLVKRILNEELSFRVHAGRCFVHDQNFGLEYQHPGQRQKLALPCGKV